MLPLSKSSLNSTLPPAVGVFVAAAAVFVGVLVAAAGVFVGVFVGMFVAATAVFVGVLVLEGVPQRSIV
jgi:hypothetical protein